MAQVEGANARDLQQGITVINTPSSPRDASSALFIERLRESPFFGPLSEDSLAYMVAQVRQTDFQAGMAVFREGEASQGLYWLQSGTLKAVKSSASGKEQILHLIRSGQTFNEVGAFTTLPNPASVVALEPVQVWCIPGDAIRRQIQQNPTFAQSIIDVLSARLRQSVGLIEDLSLRSVLNRLSRLILDEPVRSVKHLKRIVAHVDLVHTGMALEIHNQAGKRTVTIRKPLQDEL